jgi:hypothetical protein
MVLGPVSNETPYLILVIWHNRRRYAFFACSSLPRSGLSSWPLEAERRQEDMVTKLPGVFGAWRLPDPGCVGSDRGLLGGTFEAGAIAEILELPPSFEEAKLPFPRPLVPHLTIYQSAFLTCKIAGPDRSPSHAPGPRLSPSRIRSPAGRPFSNISLIVMSGLQ